MITKIKNLTSDIIQWLQDDPVRPSIPFELRVGDNSEIFLLEDGSDKPLAITCVSYQDFIPDEEEDLFKRDKEENTAVFYTIWSYKKGSGRELILQAVEKILQERPYITEFVTLSPKTEMARKFHESNGAITYRENKNTVNFMYRGTYETK